jgi:hypothetical protein
MVMIALSQDPEDLGALIDATLYHLPQVASGWFDDCKIDT